MGRKTKVDFRALGNQVRRSRPLKKGSSLIDKSIAESTFKQYRSSFSNIVSFALGLDPSTKVITKDIFLRFLEALQEQYTSAERFRSALLHFQVSAEELEGVSAGDHPWASDADILKAVQGFAYQGGKKKACAAALPARGAISKEMVDQLVALLSQKYPQLRLPIIIMFYAALRPGELSRMRVGDLKGDQLLVRGDKRSKANNTLSPNYVKHLVCPEALLAIQEASEGLSDNTPLWRRGSLAKGGWNREQLSAQIKEARRTLGWDPELQFVPHSLRHGGVAHIRDTMNSTANGSLQVADVLQMSPRMQAHYGRSNATRKAGPMKQTGYVKKADKKS